MSALAPLQPATFLVAANNFSGLNILRDHFHPVPDKYLTDLDEKSVTVACTCGSEATIGFGQMVKCGCGRFFWNGKTVQFAERPAAHTCKPNREGWCDECGEDVA